MAYEMKDGDFQITAGDKAISFKAKVGDMTFDPAVFPKKLDWGISFNGNIKSFRTVYLAFLRFTVRAVAHYWKEAMADKKETPKQAEKPAPENRKVESLLR